MEQQNPLSKTCDGINFSWDKSSEDVCSSDVYEFIPETPPDVPQFITSDVAHLVNSVKHLTDRVHLLETQLEFYSLLQQEITDLVTIYPSLRKKVDKLYDLKKKKCNTKRERR